MTTASLPPAPLLTRYYAGPASVASPPRVDRKARVIHGYAVATRGEAIGHDHWLDSTFLDQIVTAGNASPEGIKSRFTHPGLSADGLGRQVGRAKNFSRDGDVVRADLHFGDYTAKAPVFDRDPAEYLMDLAEKDPKAFGSSIVFSRDQSAMDAFKLANGGHIVQTEMGSFIKDFKSPDTSNAKNLSHVRLTALRASDVVDTPAANPDGFFSDSEELADVADRAFAYLLGLSDCAPAAVELAGADPERARRFVQGFLDRRGLVLSQAQKQGVPEMSNTPQTPAQGDPVLAAREAFAANLKSLREAFPKDLEFANTAAADGLTVEQAKARHADVLAGRLTASETALAEAKAVVEKLSAENAAIKTKLLDGDKGVPPAPGATNKKDAYEVAKKLQTEQKCSFSDAYRQALVICGGK